MAADPRHWDEVYAVKAVDDVSWYEREPAVSLALIDECGLAPGRAVDVGAGRSALPRHLIERGWQVTALDISATALDALQASLGPSAPCSCIISGILDWEPDEAFDLWHDRAVFHFLTGQEEQAAYAELAGRTVAPGGVLVMATFAPDGPDRCSGLETARHDAQSLAGIFSGAFDLERAERHEHVTPWGAVQPFTWVVMRRRP